MRARDAFGNLFFVIFWVKKVTKKPAIRSAGIRKKKMERVAGIEPA